MVCGSWVMNAANRAGSRSIADRAVSHAASASLVGGKAADRAMSSPLSARSCNAPRKRSETAAPIRSSKL